MARCRPPRVGEEHVDFKVNCKQPGCELDAKSRGWCKPHYLRWYKTGSPDAARPTAKQRIMARVNKVGDCWIWTGVTTTAPGARLSYPRFCIGKAKTVAAHRFSYELFVGPIPDGLTLDHLCRNTLCVNPSHLEPVTNRENVLRGTGPSARNARKTVCGQGHPLTSDNVRMEGSSRRCLTCQREYNRKRYLARGMSV